MLSYTQSLLIFAGINTILFLLLLTRRTFNKKSLKFTAIILLLLFDLVLFFHLVIQDLLLPRLGSSLCCFNMDISIMLLYITLYMHVFILLARVQRRNKGLYLLLVTYITMIITIFENSLNFMSHLTEVSEQTPDATVYAVYGRWCSSLKNPYYDVINVASSWIALLHRVLGINNITNATPNTVLYFTIAILISLSIYTIYQKNSSRSFALLAILIAFATPYITFISTPPALSAMFAFLSLLLVLDKEPFRPSDYITMLIFVIAGVLTHATAIAMLIFSFLSVLILLRIYRENLAKYLQYLRIFGILVSVYIALSLIRFIYTTAYLATIPYYADFLRFLNFLASPGGVELRITRYEQLSPLFTAFSWSVYPALSAAYILVTLFRKRHSHSELLALALSLAGLVLVAIGFVVSRFSNSFSREVAYPGYLLLFLGSFEVLRKICSDRVGRIVMTIIIATAVISGLFTIKNAPWLYVGKVPFLTYRPPTPSETIFAEKLLMMLNNIDEFRNIELIQSFDPGVYLVKMIELGMIKPSNPFSPPPINVQTSMRGMTNSIAFNSPFLYVLWR